MVGSSPESNLKSITIDSRFKCPTTVDKTNWIDGEGTFSVAQVGNQITITRTDTYEYDLYDYDTNEWTTYGGGWDRDLKFRCCSGHGKFCSNTLFLHILPMQRKINCFYMMKQFQSSKLLYLLVEIYYHDHPTCANAKYLGDVLEIATREGAFSQENFIKDFVKTVKDNVAFKFGANIICGGKLESGIRNYGEGVGLTMTFTGTAMKTIQA